MRNLTALFVLALSMFVLACGPTTGEAEINPEQIAEFGDASLTVETTGDAVSAKFDVTWFLFGMKIDILAHDLVVDLDGEPANCLVVGASFQGAKFQWLAHDQHPICASLLASGAITIGAPAPAGEDR